MRRIFKADIGDFILALVLALVLWFFVKSTQAPTRAVDMNTRRFPAVTVETRNRPSELDLARMTVGSVALTVRGPQDVLDKLSPQDLVAYVDLKVLREGTHQLSIRVDAPAGVEVTGATPARVDVTLEQIISTSVPVALSLVGQPASGYFAVPGVVVPENVVVTGGRTKVSSLAPFVLLLDVTNATETMAASMQLEPHTVDGQLLTGVTLNTAAVQYRQPIYPTRTVPLRVVSQGQLAPQVKEVRFELSVSEARIAAPTETLYDIDEVIVPINVSDVTAETVVEAVPVVPPGIHLVAPASFNVRIIVIPGP